MKQGVVLKAAGVAVVVSVAVALTAYLYGPVLGGTFGLIDDLEIFRYLDGASRLNIFDIPSTLVTETEVGRWGTSPRYRPVFYAFKLLEASVFGLSPSLWFAWRVVILAVFVSSLSTIAFIYSARSSKQGTTGTWLGAAIGILVALAAAILPAWTGIVLRLGPSEIYVALGLAFVAWGYFLVATPMGKRWGWILVFGGVVIAVGSKEDALPLLVFLVTTLLLDWKRIRSDKLLLAFGAVTVLFCLFVLSGVFLGTAAATQDVYGASRDLRTVAALLVGNPFLVIAMLPLVLVASFGPNPSQRVESRIGTPEDQAHRHTLKPRLIVALSVLPALLIASEAFFYQNAYADLLGGTLGLARYGLLSQAMAVASIGFGAVYVVHCSSRPWRQVSGFLVICIFFFASWFGPVTKSALTTYRSLSEEASAASMQLGVAMQSTSELIRGSSLPVLLLIQDPLDYEPAYSFPLYLETYSGVDEVSLGFLRKSEQVKEPDMRALLSSLERMAGVGNFEGGWMIRQGEPFNSGEIFNCIAFSDPVDQVLPWCQSLSVVK